jgi:hypothetical protein
MTYKFTQSQMCNVSHIVNEWQQMYQIVAEASKLGTSWIWLAGCYVHMAQVAVNIRTDQSESTVVSATQCQKNLHRGELNWQPHYTKSHWGSHLNIELKQNLYISVVRQHNWFLNSWICHRHNTWAQNKTHRLYIRKPAHGQYRYGMFFTGL